MFAQLFTKLKNRFMRLRRSRRVDLDWKAIHATLDRAAALHVQSAERQAAWEARMEQERERDRKQEQQKQVAWEARMEQERQERAQERAQERQERAEWLKQERRERAQERQERAEWLKQERRERAQERREGEKRRVENAESLKHLRRMVGGIGNKVGAAIEDFFAFAMERAMPVLIDGIQFDEIFVNKTYSQGDKEMQCDIVLVNKEYIAILEVKHFLESDHIVAFDRKLRSVLPDVLPERYRRLRVVPVMACMGFSTYATEKVQQHGIAVMRPDGQDAKTNTEHMRIRAPRAAR